MKFLTVSVLGSLAAGSSAASAADWRSRSIYQVFTDRYVCPFSTCEGVPSTQLTISPVPQPLLFLYFQSLCKGLVHISWERSDSQMSTPRLRTNRYTGSLEQMAAQLILAMSRTTSTAEVRGKALRTSWTTSKTWDSLQYVSLSTIVLALTMIRYGFLQ
jgi:hypothetical protein